MNKKIIISAVALIIITILAIAVINEIGLNYKIEKIEQYNYFVLKQNEKYGVIDKNGNVVVNPNYEAVQIPNQSKPVFVCIDGYDQEKDDYKTIVYNEKNEVLFSEYKNVQAIAINTNIDTTPYEKSVLMYKQDGKCGLINLEGKQITKPIYDEISNINYNEGTFLVKQDEKEGIINMNGKVIVKPNYETVTSDNYYAKDNSNVGFIVSQKTEDGYRYGYLSSRGNTVLKSEYTEIERVTEIKNEKQPYFIAFKDGQAGLLKNNKVILNYEYEDIQYNVLSDIFIVRRNGKIGAVTREGKSIIYPEYDNILFGGIYLNAIKQNETIIFDLQGNKVETDVVSMTQTDNPNYFITIDSKNIYKVTDAQGNIIIDNDYNYIEYLPGDYFIVSRDWKNGVIDIEGKSLIDIKFDSIFRLNETNLLQAETNKTKSIELYNLDMKKIIGMDNATVKECEKSDFASKKYIMIYSENNFEYYDENGNKLKAQEIFNNNTLFAKKINDKWGFVDANENIKVQNDYEMVTDFNKCGFAGIKKDGKWGVINKEGTIVQEPTYELEWNMPEFLGKYYRVNAWYGDEIYSND